MQNIPRDVRLPAYLGQRHVETLEGVRAVHLIIDDFLVLITHGARYSAGYLDSRLSFGRCDFFRHPGDLSESPASIHILNDAPPRAATPLYIRASFPIAELIALLCTNSLLLFLPTEFRPVHLSLFKFR